MTYSSAPNDICEPAPSLRSRRRSPNVAEAHSTQCPALASVEFRLLPVSRRGAVRIIVHAMLDLLKRVLRRKLRF